MQQSSMHIYAAFRALPDILPMGELFTKTSPSQLCPRDQPNSRFVFGQPRKPSVIGKQTALLAQQTDHCRSSKAPGFFLSLT